MAGDDEMMADSQSQELLKSASAAAEGSSAQGGPGASGQGAKGATTWNTKKWQEEYELAKYRLADQKFSSTDYQDPFAPRGVNPKAYPNGTTAELEQKLKSLADKIRSQGA